MNIAWGLKPTAFLCCLALCAGCSVPAVGVQLVFPSEASFLVASFASIDVYDLAEGDDGDAICAALTEDASTAPDGVTAAAASGQRQVCEFRAGGVSLKEVSVGRKVFFAVVEDQAGPILSGCVLREVTASSSGDDANDDLHVSNTVKIPLRVLDGYPDVEPTCAGVDEKCEENQPCVP